MRILAVFQHYMPPTKIMGGGERRFIEICKCWSRQGVEVDVIENPPCYVETFPYYRCHKIFLPFNSFPEKRFTAHYKIWAGTAYAFAGAQHLRGDYDIVYAHAPTVEDLITARSLSRRLGIPWVVVHHHHYFSTEKGINVFNIYKDCRKVASSVSAAISTFEFFLIRKLALGANAQIAVSNYTKRQLTSTGYPEESIHVSGNGVDVKYIDSFPEQDEKLCDGVSVGRVSPVKGSLDLIEIWHRVVKAIPDARLVIVGGTKPYVEASMRRRIRELGLNDNVHLAGLVSEEDKLKFLKGSKIFVFPSLAEGWGLAPAEGLACRLPVVCYNLDVLKENFTHGAVFVSLGDFDRFAEEVVKLLKDEAYRIELGREGRKLAETYSWGSIASRELEILEKVAGA